MIELLVSMAILALLAATLGIALDVGIRTFGASGSGDRTAAARDISEFEVHLGADVARSACLTTPASGGPAGACANSFLPLGTCPAGALICIAFPQPQAVGSPTYLCHLVSYASTTTAPAGVVRTEQFTGGSNVGHVTVDPVAFSAGGGVSVQPAATGALPWATVRVQGLKSANPALRAPPVATMQFAPVSTIPTSSLVNSAC